MLQGWTRDVTVAFLPVEKAASFSGLVTVTCVLIFPARHREQQTSIRGKAFNHNEGTYWRKCATSSCAT